MTMTKRHWRWVVPATLLVLAVAGASAWRVRARASAGFGLQAGVFRLGERFDAPLSLTLRLRIGNQPEQRLAVKAKLSTTATDAQDGTVDVDFRLRDVRVEVGGQPPEAEGADEAMRRLAAELSTPVFVRHRLDGAALAVFTPPQLNPGAANVLFAMAGLIQHVQSPARVGDVWTAEELDGNGECLVTYTRVGPDRISKRKLRYRSADLGSTEVALPRPELRDGSFELATTPEGRLTSIRGTERVRVAFAGLAFETAVQIELGPSEVSSDARAIGAFGRVQRQLRGRRLGVPSGDGTGVHAAADRAVLAGATLDDLRRAIAQAPSALTAAERSSLVRRIEALVRLEPTANAELRSDVARLPSAQGRLIVDAWSLAGTDEAQAELATLARNGNVPDEHRAYAIRYLAHQERPTLASIAALEALLDDRDPDRRQMVRFAYGTCAAKLRRRDPERARAMVRALEERLASAPAVERADLLLALGNTSHPDARATLESEAAGAGDARTVAIEALGQIDDPRANTTLEAHLHAEDELLRLAAIRAVNRREIGAFVPSLLQIAKADGVLAVRRAAREVLASHVRTTPGLQSAVAALPELPPGLAQP